jgi:hypothetical protein
MMICCRPRTFLVLILALAAGCGYFMAGTWEDDPGNWKRAFHSTKPGEVVVIHSKYWRSSHWSYEFQYFFEIAPNMKLTGRLFAENKLRRITGDEATKAQGNRFGDAPSWFAPKSVTEYEIWVFDKEPERNFKVLIDKKSGHIFMSDYQV